MTEQYEPIVSDGGQAGPTPAARLAAEVLRAAVIERKYDFAAPAVHVEWEGSRSIRAALERADSGKYGSCEACGEQIGRMRLIAIPWAHLCAPCQLGCEAPDGTGRVSQTAPEARPVGSRQAPSRSIQH